MWFRKKLGQEAEDRLQTLSRRLDDLESKHRTIGLEWNDTLDRIERVLGRLVKRAQRDRAAIESETHGAEGGAGDSAPAPPNGVDEVAVRRSRTVNPARR